MSRVMSEDRVFCCLLDIYENTQTPSKISPTEFIKKYHLGTYVLPVLIEAGILKKIKKGFYVWKSIKPNIHMVKKVIEKTKEKNAIAGKKIPAPLHDQVDKWALNGEFKIQDEDIFDENVNSSYTVINPFFDLHNTEQQIQEKDEEIGLLNNQINHLKSKLDVFESEKDLLKNNLDESEKMVKELKEMYEQEKNVKKTKGHISNSTSTNTKEFNLLWGVLKIKW